jgi:hypothetical protein
LNFYAQVKMKIAESLTDLVGRTPMVWLRRLTEARVASKLEAFNPGRSGMGPITALGSEPGALCTSPVCRAFLLTIFSINPKLQ